jgi:molybdate transport system substrate-binding protein
MKLRSVLLVLGLSGVFAACVVGCEPSESTTANSPTSKRLTVLAAASLADSFKEIGAGFEGSHPGVKVEFSFAGSNQLRTQLENGAKGDVFAAADRKQIDAAVASKVVDGASVRVFAINRLALIVPKANTAGLKSFQDLARPGLKVVVADKAVPVGNYTRLMLEKADPAFAKGVDANIVSREENVAAVVAKVALGEADAGIAYASDAAGKNGDKLAVLTIPAELDQRAEYLIAVTSHPGDAAIAMAFVEAVASREGQGSLRKRGFAVPADTASTGSP